MKTHNVLIVDDIEMNRDRLFQLVSMLGQNPILAEGGLVALEKLKKQPIDLVLLDIMMPEIDGYEVLSHIKDDAGLRHIPVIMITALDDTESAVHCINMGADDYLTKPFNRVLLKARITACLERKELRDKEDEYRRQIEEYNMRLEEMIREQTQELSAVNERLRMLDKAKGDALKLIYYDFHNSLRGLFKKVVRGGREETNDLLETVKQSFHLTQIDPSTIMFTFELNAVRSILELAIERTRGFAQSRHVLIGPIPDCGGQLLDDNPLDTIVSPEFGDELGRDFSFSSMISWQVVTDDEQSAEQKELCANALAELLKTAIKYSRYDSTVELSCEPFENEVSVSIHATGRIIPEKELSQFFETLSDKGKVIEGRHPGLGPSTAQNIFTLLGGSVIVKNRATTGISFVVTLKRENFKST
ncbi:MAG: response regulator [Candidatus Parabeggiatoa sp.]|nr:response regulator [Candidatus Parabeggiatoa sp.]